MGSHVDAPKPTAEERALQAKQAQLLDLQSQIITRQMDQQQALLPFMAEQLGMKIIKNKDGQIIGAKKIVTAQDKQRTAIENQLLQRTQDALGGKLPVDPGLESQLGNQEQTLREKLQQQFGPGYETSTPGIQALQEFQKSADSLRYGARTGQLTLAEQLGLSHQEMDLQQQQQQMGLFRQAAVGDPLSFASGAGSTAQGYGQAQVPYIQQRQMELQANMFNAQNSGLGAIGGIFGQLFGAVAPMAFG
jgi:hypothetical protein